MHASQPQAQPGTRVAPHRRVLRHAARLLLGALLTLPALAGTAADGERIAWNLDWKTGDSWVYESIDTSARSNSGRRTAFRVTSRSEMSVDTATDTGFTLRSTTREPALSLTEGDRTITDNIAPFIDSMDGVSVLVDTDRRLRNARVRNFTQVQGAVRRGMEPTMRKINDAVLTKMKTEMNHAQWRTAELAMREQSAKALDSFTSRASLEPALLSTLRGFGRFMGEQYQTGKRERRRDTLYTPTYAQPLFGVLQYEIEAVPDHPELARLRWTGDVLTDLDPAGQWRLAEEILQGKLVPDAKVGMPVDLMMQERGVMVFRRKDGALLGYSMEVEAEYTPHHTLNDTRQLRLVGLDLDWDAVLGKPGLDGVEPRRSAPRSLPERQRRR